MSLNLKPLSDRVVVEPDAAKEKSSGGIILPDTAQEKPQQGTVVAVGPGKASDAGTIIEMTVKSGDKVQIGRASCRERV